MCDELKAKLKLMRPMDSDFDVYPVYCREDVDAVIAEKDKEIVELKAEKESLLQQNREICQALHEMYSKEEYDELKQKLEDAKATAYTESVDASMREHRLKRALYKACANWADVEVFERTVGIDDPNVEACRWALMRNKCLKKAEEYK